MFVIMLIFLLMSYSTGGQMMYMAQSIIMPESLSREQLEPAVEIMVWLTGGLTILSAATYLVNWLAHMASYEEPRQTIHRPAHKALQNRRTTRGKEPVAGS